MRAGLEQNVRGGVCQSQKAPGIGNINRRTCCLHKTEAVLAVAATGLAVKPAVRFGPPMAERKAFSVFVAVIFARGRRFVSCLERPAVVV